MMRHAKTWLAILLLVLLVIFSLQNMAVIQVIFLGMGIETRRIVLILASVIVGFVLGKSIRVRRI